MSLNMDNVLKIIYGKYFMWIKFEDFNYLCEKIIKKYSLLYFYFMII